jgi:ATP-dependent Lhr-like helicase
MSLTETATAVPLAGFAPAARAWFASPTAVQAAWAAIGAGENALVIAPTGYGKTLATGLLALSAALKRERQGIKKP